MRTTSEEGSNQKIEEISGTKAEKISVTKPEEASAAKSEEEFELNPVSGSLFYMVFLAMVVPAIIGFITDSFHLHFLSEKELSVLSLTNPLDTITTIIPVLFPIGAQVVLSKALGRRDKEELARSYTSVVLGQTVLVLIVTSVRNKRENQPPASLGLSYFREER